VPRFPSGVPKGKVLRALQSLGFRIRREREHISLERVNSDGSSTPITMPNHPRLKASTLRSLCTQAGISREDFLQALTDA
jgi:hypothetical protein